MSPPAAEAATGCCEGCLTRERLRSLSDECCADGVSEPYLDMFLSCFNMKIGERSGSAEQYFVCERCADRLTEACRFRRQVMRSQELLRETLYIKEEPEEVDVKVNYSSDEPLQNKVQVKLDVDCSPTREGVSSDCWLKQEIFTEVTPNSVDREKPKRKYKKKNKEDKKVKKAKEPLPMDVKTLTCRLCERAFETINLLQRHMAEHFPEHLCDICGNVFRKPEHLKNHLKTHTTIECTKCNKVMKEISLKKHLENRHTNKKKTYRCGVCGEKFPGSSVKKMHLKTAHGVNIGGECKLCGKVFTFKSNLRLHIRSVHQKEENAFCQFCSKGFINDYALSRHMLKHTGVRNHVCPICRKAYLKKDTLTAHMKIHSTVKDFVCTLCAKSFTYKCSLKGHMKNHHPHVGFEGSGSIVRTLEFLADN